MRLARLAAVLALCACPKGKSPPSDHVSFEVHTPLHATIRVREVEEAADCADVAGIEWMKCLFRTTTTSCSWLEVDTPALAASPMGTELDDCRRLRETGARVGLGQPLAGGFKLDVAPTGDRLALETAPGAALVLWLLDGEVVGTAHLGWPIDWSGTETLADRLPAMFAVADDATSRRLIDHARRSGGEVALVELLGVIETQSLDRWASLYDELEDEQLKAQALASMHEELHADETDANLIASLIEYPELQPADFGALVASAATQLVAVGSSWYDYQPLLDEMLARNDVRAGELACRVYGRQVLSTMYAGVDEYDELGDPEVEYGAISTVAKTKVACPWLQIALENDPCSATLRCQGDGGLMTTEYIDDTAGFAYDDTQPVVTDPLCTRAVADTAIRRPPEDSEEVDVGSHPGPVLLSAAWARGVVPAELLKRNARRMYRIAWPELHQPEGYDGGEEFDDWELNADEGPCRRPRALSDAVCRLPLSLSEITFAGCRLRIDDKAQVVRVEELKVK